MKTLKSALLILTAFAHPVAAGPPPKAGDIVFASDFNTSAQQQAWTEAGFATWTQGFGESPSLRVTVSSGKHRRRKHDPDCPWT